LSGFIVVYRWQVPEEQETPFRRQWQDATLKLRSEGALGSCLTRDEEGKFVAIALWPSEEARAKAFSNLTRVDPLPGVMRLGETQLHVESDLWLNSPFGG
jgi:hypothetical protein